MSARAKVVKLTAATCAALLLFAGVAAAHTVTVDPPTGPWNTFAAPNGMFGVFCGQKYINVAHDSTGYNSGAITQAKYSPSYLCSDYLALDANLAYAAAYLYRSNGTLCASTAGYNTQGQPGVVVSVYGCGAPPSGSKYTYGYHSISLYGNWYSSDWSTPAHSSL